MDSRLQLCLGILLALWLPGCTTLKVPAEHVVMFDSLGQPVNPTGNIGSIASIDASQQATPAQMHTTFLPYPEENPAEYNQHLHKISEAMDRFHSGKPLKKVMLFIHGGLNTQLDSVERLVESFNEEGGEHRSRVDLIKNAGYYPLFVNWKSSLLSSYAEHLFWLRQGEANATLGALTWPVVLTIDLGRALLRWPLVFGSLVMNDIKTIPVVRNELPDQISKELICRYQQPDDLANCIDNQVRFGQAPWPCPFDWQGVPPLRPAMAPQAGQQTFPISVGDDARECPELLGHFAMWLVTWPTKLLTAPVIDAFGTSSWDVMLRHTELLFESEQELKSSPLTNAATTQHNLAELPAHGGLSQFLEMLATKIQADPTANWEITLVGHSMGTIVANKIIERFGDRLPIKNILYLAAADTVQHYQQAIYPYLQQNDTHGLHHFMLHPQAEEGEISLGMPWDIPPRGSLLVWIDNFLSKPLTGTDRTVGRYDNLLPALHNAPSDIRDRISVKVFSAGNPVEPDNPLGHGDVGRRFKFWETKCWEATTESGCLSAE